MQDFQKVSCHITSSFIVAVYQKEYRVVPDLVSTIFRSIFSNRIENGIYSIMKDDVEIMRFL